MLTTRDHSSTDLSDSQSVGLTGGMTSAIRSQRKPKPRFLKVFWKYSFVIVSPVIIILSALWLGLVFKVCPQPTLDNRISTSTDLSLIHTKISHVSSTFTIITSPDTSSHINLDGFQRIETNVFNSEEEDTTFFTIDSAFNLIACPFADITVELPTTVLKNITLEGDDIGSVTLYVNGSTNNPVALGLLSAYLVALPSTFTLTGPASAQGLHVEAPGSVIVRDLTLIGPNIANITGPHKTTQVSLCADDGGIVNVITASDLLVSMLPKADQSIYTEYPQVRLAIPDDSDTGHFSTLCVPLEAYSGASFHIQKRWNTGLIRVIHMRQDAEGVWFELGSVSVDGKHITTSGTTVPDISLLAWNEINGCVGGDDCGDRSSSTLSIINRGSISLVFYEGDGVSDTDQLPEMCWTGLN
eukprot:gnl/Dysnectes_brevis/4782_a6590_668.p1 GENE.gnl/Dysnectes_brevis/4782_a6590_668~~gnl/Dysnectes_brevis/4782_a6590_668.p1  ORF type:complete len:413 (-),score=89.40 gnl/Dysnectes_brevis/4782_a6590_668:35-1273(-)